MNWAVDTGLTVFFVLVVLVYTLRGILASVWGAARAVIAFAASYALGPWLGDIVNRFFLYDKMNKPALSALLSKILGYLIIFLVVFILLCILGWIIRGKIKKVPVINTVNKVLGFCLGLVAAFIYVWVICWGVSFIVEKNLAGQAADAVKLIAEKSFLLKFFCNLSPLDYININQLK